MSTLLFLLHPMLRSNSDDKVDENKLSSAFDITCRAWKVRLVSHPALVLC